MGNYSRCFMIKAWKDGQAVDPTVPTLTLNLSHMTGDFNCEMKLGGYGCYTFFDITTFIEDGVETYSDDGWNLNHFVNTLANAISSQAFDYKVHLHFVSDGGSVQFIEITPTQIRYVAVTEEPDEEPIPDEERLDINDASYETYLYSSEFVPVYQTTLWSA